MTQKTELQEVKARQVFYQSHNFDTLPLFRKKIWDRFYDFFIFAEKIGVLYSEQS
jgi:hypothetical protein